MGDCGEECMQDPLLLLLVMAADCAHGCLERGGFLGAGGVTRGEKPVDFVLGDGGGKPAEEEVCGFWQRNLAERDAERKLEEWGARGAGIDLEEGAFDFAATGGCVLRDHEETGIGVGGELTGGPESAGG
jgi:hypothetical protein